MSGQRIAEGGGNPHVAGGRGWAAWLRPAVVVLLGALAASPLAVLSFGAVFGEEFSPDAFRRRTYSYYEIPLLGVQVWPIARQERTGLLETYLTREKYIVPDRQADPRWDLVYELRGGAMAYRGDADILCIYLDAYNDQGELYWLNWTKSHPELAKVLWPEVAKAARRGLYIFVPELMTLANNATEPQQLQQDLDDELSRRCSSVSPRP